jgi:hypothetical protein
MITLSDTTKKLKTHFSKSHYSYKKVGEITEYAYCTTKLLPECQK